MQSCISQNFENIRYLYLVITACKKVREEGMKKWLTETPSFSNDDTSHEHPDLAKDACAPVSEIQWSDNENLKKKIFKRNMGIGVSSEPLPPTFPTNKSSNPTSFKQFDNACHPSVFFDGSVNNRISTASPCKSSPQDIDAQLYQANPKSVRSASLSKKIPPVLIDDASSRYTVGSEQMSYQQQRKSVACCSTKNTAEDSQEVNDSSSLSDPQAIALSLPPLYKIKNSLCNVNVPDDDAFLSLSNSAASQVKMVDVGGSSSVTKLESIDGSWCKRELGQAFVNKPSTNFNHESLASVTKDFLGSSAGPSTSSGCGHLCSTCRVQVHVEVECVPGSQRSPNGGRRGIRTLSFAKRVRHKVKAPTKEFNGTQKKKKNPWSFRLNCRLRANKNDEQEQTLSSLNVGCVSCVCPGYRRADAMPVYKSVLESNCSNGMVFRSPIVDLSHFNPVSELEECTRQDLPKDMAEAVDAPAGFVPLSRENQNSLGLPLTYNSMIDLQILLESSLRLDLGGSRTSGITYPGENLVRHMRPLTSETFLAHPVHTQVDYIHCLVPDLLTITNCGFYWGKMDRYEAERLLENRPEGTFLLRDSAQEEYLFSVSFRRYERSLHARIEQWDHKFSFDSHDPGVFASHTVCGLIEHYKDPSCCMFFEPLLTNPLARTFPFPLQHLCRASICSKTTYDGINHLELPKSLKNYLKEYHYKQRVRVRHLD